MPSIFSQILQGQIPGDILYQDDIFFVIKDINPLDTTHLLIIPKTEVKDINSLDKESNIYQNLLGVIQELASCLEKPEYKILSNCGSSVGQTVFHLHIHLISPYKLLKQPSQ